MLIPSLYFNKSKQKKIYNQASATVKVKAISPIIDLYGFCFLSNTFHIKQI